jgi:precorrin-2 dehydrogenase/sirohydrochlorin ferrochelatase
MRANATGLPITLDVEGKVVVLVGVDEAKRELLTEAGAQVRAVSDFAESLLEGASLVMLTAKDAPLAERVRAACAKKNVLLWCCDNPSQSDFAMPAIARLGMARIAISTSGASPALAGRVREILEKALGERFARFVEVLGALRDRAKQEPDEGKRRAVLQAALDGFDADIAVRYPKWFK